MLLGMLSEYSQVLNKCASTLINFGTIFPSALPYLIPACLLIFWIWGYGRRKYFDYFLNSFELILNNYVKNAIKDLKMHFIESFTYITYVQLKIKKFLPARLFNTCTFINFKRIFPPASLFHPARLFDTIEQVP